MAVAIYVIAAAGRASFKGKSCSNIVTGGRLDAHFSAVLLQLSGRDNQCATPIYRPKNVAFCLHCFSLADAFSGGGRIRAQAGDFWRSLSGSVRDRMIE